MEFEGFKSAWQRQYTEGQSLSSSLPVSRSLQFLRTSAIHDLQRSDELSRFIFSLLFALVAIGASLKVLSPGAGRIAAWLFAAALLVDGITGMALLVYRHREQATSTMVEYVRREHRMAETRLRLERYSQRLMVLLAGITLLLLLFDPKPVLLRENLVEPFGRMAIITAFLAVAWRRAKSRSREIRSELERYLKDLEK
jgi:hypothetical protein